MAAMLDANAADVIVRQIISWITPLFNRIVRQMLRPAAPTTLIGALTDLTRRHPAQIHHSRQRSEVWQGVRCSRRKYWNRCVADPYPKADREWHVRALYWECTSR